MIPDPPLLKDFKMIDPPVTDGLTIVPFCLTCPPVRFAVPHDKTGKGALVVPGEVVAPDAWTIE